ncbi:hypothetical protein [Shinella granuli]|uniref:hypothetical protein n=1 Tax=Shinella granuli TaxID=323621 RepID=UPI001054B12C|nr:hypothetical protein [Shinella granuli]
MLTPFLRRYFAEVAVYGGGAITLLTFSGNLNQALSFFERYQAPCVIVLVIHFVVSFAAYAGRKERREIAAMRRQLEKRDD